jgi:UDP-N-acetylglucosamine:LPS N-acetylglucosamine transferase
LHWWLQKIPVYIHEQTITVGLANKIASKFAKKYLLHFQTQTSIFQKTKIHTGNLLKQEHFSKKFKR